MSHRKNEITGSLVCTERFKISKEDVLVRSKWRRLIRGTEEDTGNSGG